MPDLIGCTCPTTCHCRATKAGVLAFITALIVAAVGAAAAALWALAGLMLAGAAVLVMWGAPKLGRRLLRLTHRVVRWWEARRLAVVVEDLPMPAALPAAPARRALPASQPVPAPRWAQLERERTR